MVAAIKTVLNLYLNSSLTGTKETVLNFIHPYCILASQVFDHVLKRMSVRRQKRWWNAYMLFYCRADLDDPDFEVLKSEFEVGVLLEFDVCSMYLKISINSAIVFKI